MEDELANLLLNLRVAQTEIKNQQLIKAFQEKQQAYLQLIDNLKKLVKAKDEKIELLQQESEKNQQIVQTQKKQIEQLEEATQFFSDHLSIYIYYPCIKQPKCAQNPQLRPFLHQACERKAKFHFNGKISCEGGCPFYNITEAYFYCKERQVCSKSQAGQSAYKPEIIQDQIHLSQLVFNGLEQSQYSNEDRLKFQNLQTKFPYYWGLLLK